MSSTSHYALMKNDKWRDRLADAIKQQNRSLRQVSLQAGKGAGYLHSILVEGKDPSVDNLTDVCHALGISLAFALYGLDISPQKERLLRLYDEHPEMQDGIMRLLESQG